AITGVGVGLPLDSSVTVGEPISVDVRLSVLVPPGRNSLTMPLTVTESPILTVGALLVNTKMPSEVASSASGFGSCIQKPLLVLAVTMPGTLPTAAPRYGE